MADKPKRSHVPDRSTLKTASGSSTHRPARPTKLTLPLLAQGVALLAHHDQLLRLIVQKHGSPPLWDRPPGFATLLQIILEQQVSLASAAALFRRLETGMGGALTPETIAITGSDGLKQFGVTRQKARYIEGLAQDVSLGRLDLTALARLPDEEVMERLTKVPGVGPWTASIYLLMALRRPDIWPVGDLALNRFLSDRLGRAISSSEASTIAEQWRPWRAVAARILWHGYLSYKANRPLDSGVEPRHS